MKLAFSLVAPGAAITARVTSSSSHGTSTAAPRTPLMLVNRLTTARLGCGLQVDLLHHGVRHEIAAGGVGVTEGRLGLAGNVRPQRAHGVELGLGLELTVDTTSQPGRTGTGEGGEEVAFVFAEEVFRLATDEMSLGWGARPLEGVAKFGGAL